MITIGALAMLLAQQGPCLVLPGDRKPAAAEGLAWYVAADTIVVRGRRYSKYGLPRLLMPGEVRYIADYKGATVAVETTDPVPQIVYVLARAGCEFQPYAIED